MTTRDRGILVLLAVIWAVGVGAVYRYASPTDEWAGWIDAGDALAAGRTAPPPAPAGLSARAAYLLAFHHAQDAGDVPRMLAVADRLERLGEREVASWARYVAGEVVAERARSPSE